MTIKLPKEAVQYTDDHGSSSEQCSKCVHYVSAHVCAIVAGAIKPGGWCNHFDRKEDSMPSTSQAQHGFAAMSRTPEGRAKLRAHGKKPMPMSVAQDYMAADRGRKIGKLAKHAKKK